MTRLIGGEKSIRPISFNKRITIQDPTETSTNTKGVRISYSDNYSVWASVLPIKGRKRLEYARLEYSYLYEVKMRTRETNPGITNRIKYNDNYYTIIDILIGDEIIEMDIGR